MAEARLQVEIIKREIIRPFSPTPPHLKTYKLSLLDQFQVADYGHIFLIYTKNDLITSEQQSQRLKASLSKTLALFYPAAGQLDDNATIECSDEGAQFIEALSDGLLSALLSQPADLKSLHKLLPVVVTSQEPATWPLLLVQATHFACGGLAVGVCLSHKFADATTFGNFIKSWAKYSRGSGETAVLPTFGASSYFPPIDLASPVLQLKMVECATKRFVFEKEKIVSLKARAASDEIGGFRDPSRVEAVTALIWKCALNAAASPASLTKKKIVAKQAINLRRMANPPPFPDTLVGNLIGTFTAETDEIQPDVKHLAAKLRKGLMEYREKKGKRLRGDEACVVFLEGLRESGELFARHDISVMFFTSLCNFGLYEGADFGWGRPAWATIPVVTEHPNMVSLMDTASGGVEAWVTLSRQDMAVFENDSLLAKFAYNASATKSAL